VRKFRQAVLLAVGAIFALAAIVLLAVNLYVQSQGIQTRIQQELSQRLGTPLTVQRISVTPWGGLKLSGITVPQIAAPETDNFLVAKTFRLRIRFSSLFSRRLVVKEVSLSHPRVVWLQSPNGKWQLPGSMRPETPSVPSPVEKADSVARVRLVPEIRRIKVSGGEFRFLDVSGAFVAAFEGLDLRSNMIDAATLRGNAFVTKISLRDRFYLQRMRSTVSYSPRALDISKILAQAGGGDVTGGFAMQPDIKGSPFNLAIKFRNVEADRIIMDAGGEKGVIKGKLDGSFEARGEIANRNALQGTGEIFLRDGQLRQYSLLAALGQILQIEELTQLHLEQAQAKYHIDSGTVMVDELILRSPNIRLSAKGTIAFDGKLHLDSQLAINDKVRNQLFKPIRSNFQPSNDPGYFAVDFEVGGTVDRPKSNLMDKVVGRDLKDFGNVISSFLGGGKSSRKGKQESASPSPAVSATPAPSP
jgi:type II secretion system protein N